MRKVSVIIPVYNTGGYLTECIESIINQTYKILQIIIVDDGSELETAELCDQLMARDSRIKVIHKKNEGVSIARNTGLSIASGEIVCFVDSDDTIDNRMISIMVEAIEASGAQIAMCDALTIRPGKPNEDDTIPDFAQSCIINVKDLSAATLSRLAGSACRCAYMRTDTILAQQARFPEGIKFSEDRIFNLMAMSQASKIAYIKQPLYNRLIRKGSACFRYYPDMTQQIVSMRSVLIDTVSRFWGKQYIEAYERQVTGQVIYATTNFTAPYSGNSLVKQYKLIKELCHAPQIQECIRNSRSEDFRSKLVLNQKALILTVVGNLINCYHRICKRGQYQA